MGAALLMLGSRFVQRHVSAVSLEEELNAVADNARQRCPSGMEKICERLMASVKSALVEQAAASERAVHQSKQ